VLEALSLPFFQRVLIAGLLVSITCGIIGTYVVAKRITSISGGVSHAAFGGVGLGYLMGFDPMLGAAGFALATGLAIGLAYRRLRSGLDTLISMVWAVGMALGMLFIAATPGYTPDLTSYLFGSLLFVPWSYVGVVAVLDLVVIAAATLLYKEFQAVTFDEEFAEVTGVPAEAIFLLLLALSSLAIVTLIRVVGVILAIALLTVPAAVGRQWADSLKRMMAIAVVVSAGSTMAGLLGSYWLSSAAHVSAPPGPLSVLLASTIYGASFGLHALLRRRRSGISAR
jgi:zinc transport system permease protein